jgi:pSer/pThr/pTyr-binding forkhead associated (FHA) protein
VSEEDLPSSQVSPWPREVIEEPDATPPVPLHVVIVSTGRQIRLPPIAKVRIGRLDAANDIVPDLDLTPDVQPGDGVSRLHCRIHQRGSTYLVEDIGSANGTFLNGQRLTPYLSYVLENGDELQLGRFKIRIVGQGIDTGPT